MFHSNIQDALMGNCDFPDLVVPRDISTVINVSMGGLPLVIEGTHHLGAMKVFFDRNHGQANPPMWQSLEFRQLVPRDRPIDETKWDAFSCYMRTDGVIAQVSCWILKSSGGNDDNTTVRKIGPTYGQDCHMHQINIPIQQMPTDEQILVKTSTSETPEERKN
jgi:hypothetical protein